MIIAANKADLSQDLEILKKISDSVILVAPKLNCF